MPRGVYGKDTMAGRQWMTNRFPLQLLLTVSGALRSGQPIMKYLHRAAAEVEHKSELIQPITKILAKSPTICLSRSRVVPAITARACDRAAQRFRNFRECVAPAFGQPLCLKADRTGILIRPLSVLSN